MLGRERFPPQAGSARRRPTFTIVLGRVTIKASPLAFREGPPLRGLSFRQVTSGSLGPRSRLWTHMAKRLTRLIPICIYRSANLFRALMDGGRHWPISAISYPRDI